MSGWLMASLGAVVLCAGPSAYAAVGGVHAAVAVCAACHAAGNAVDAAQATRLVASQEVLCMRCHEQAARLSHPTGFAPRRALPAEYPVDWKGELTCSTCHSMHGGRPGLLRGTRRAKAFCLACHDQAFFSRMKDAGISLVLSGHLDASVARGDVDPYSRHCLGCHDGGHAGGGAVSVGKGGMPGAARGATTHPIASSYRDAAARGGYRPEHRLTQTGLLLSDGKVSCVSCHEGYAKEHGRLVMPNDRSALCLTCHDK